MALDHAKLEKSLRKIKKALRRAECDATPKNVHALRTRCRRVEAAVTALDPGHPGQRLREALDPIRKQAGKVRDLDVFISFMPELMQQGEQGGLTQLMEHLAGERRKVERKLRRRIGDHRRDAEQAAKDCALKLALHFDRQAERAMAVVLELSAELNAWPRLTRTNLHDFRLKTKELRYVLELAEGEESPLAASLGEVKDAIGAWHDWSELKLMAKKVLGAGPLVTRIAARDAEELKRALKLAAKLREEHLGGQGPRRPVGSERPAKAMLIETVRLAG